MSFEKRLIQLFFLVFTTPSFAQFYTEAQKDSLNYWCDKADGLENMVRFLDENIYVGFYRQDSKLQAAALGLTWKESLIQDAENFCRKDLDESNEVVEFEFSPPQIITVENGSSLIINKITNENFTPECIAEWNEWCENKYDIEGPPLSQVCKITYRFSDKRGNTKFELKPSYWIDDKKTKYARFNGYKLRVRADGNNEILNRVGAKIVAKDFTLWTVPRDYTLEQRRLCGCDIKIHQEYQEEISSDETILEPNDEQTEQDDNEEIEAICNLVRFDRVEQDGTVYKGINWGSLWIIFPNGNKLKQSIVPGNEYKLEEGYGFNCGN